MKTTARFLAMLTLALVATTARAESYTFTSGTDIPLASSGTAAAEYVTLSNCSIDNSGDGYVVGSTRDNTTIAISLSNATTGDYYLTWKGGANNLTANYTVTVTDGGTYSRSASYSQPPTGNWTPVRTQILTLDSLPAGALTLTFAVTSTTGSYAGNYGYFNIATLETMTALVIPPLAPADLTAAYCSTTARKDADSINTTHADTTMTFALYFPEEAKYGFSYKSGAASTTAKVSWVLSNADGTKVWPTDGGTDDGVDTIDSHSNWTLVDLHSHEDMGTLAAGLYTLVGTISDVTGSFGGNYGSFAFTAPYDAVVDTVVAWGSDYLTKARSITLTDSGYLVFDGTGGSATISGVSFDYNGTGSIGDRLLVRTGDAAKTGTATYDAAENTVTVTVSETAAEATVWCGNSEANWTDAANWTHGAPSATFPASFLGDATVTLDAAATVKTLDLNGHTATLVSDGKNLKINEFDANETGTIALKRVSLLANGTDTNNRLNLDIPSGVTIKILKDGTNSSVIQDNWGIVTVNGPVVFEDGACFQTLYEVRLVGGASGNGAISTNGSGDRWLGGDWSGFTGSYASGNTPVFIGDFDGSAATWQFSSHIKVGTSAETAGTVKLGSFTYNPTSAVNLELQKDTTLELGGGSINFANVTLKGGSLSLKKVGADGALTLDGGTYQTVEVAAGTLAIGATAPAITTLSFAEGALFTPNLSLGALNVTTATVGGLKVKPVSPATGTSYDLITAGTMTGAPCGFAVDADGSDLAAGNGLAKNYWLVKARGNVLKLYEGNPNAGFVIILR